MRDHGEDHMDGMNWRLVEGLFRRNLIQKLRDIMKRALHSLSKYIAEVNHTTKQGRISLMRAACSDRGQKYWHSIIFGVSTHLRCQ